MKKAPYLTPLKPPRTERTMTSSPKPSLKETRPRWSVAQSKKLYHVSGWGEPYFNVNEAGHVTVRAEPSGESETIDLHEMIEQIHQRGHGFPMLLRFPDILEHRVRLINECFQRAIAEHGYRESYRGVFPIKVNQQRHLIDDLVAAGKPWQYGLEAGSKPELLIALAAMNEQHGFIICNGYKDRAFIETALIAQRFSNTVLIVLERQDEIELVLEASQRLGIRPQLGVRSKLSSRGAGKWAASAGDRAKFGLTTPQLIDVVETLKRHDMLDCLRLLHFHIGSQVSTIEPWNKALQEASNIYAELVKMGCQMGYMDVGGGLAVDYDGSQSSFHASMNYDVQQYADGVVSIIGDVCDHHGVAHPRIVTESGRAVASHQSVLVFEAIGQASDDYTPLDGEPSDHEILKKMRRAHELAQGEELRLAWSKAKTALADAREMFRLGMMSLRDMGQIEGLYSCCAQSLQRQLEGREQVPRDLGDVAETLDTIYYCNFSLFQSAPDIWALDQLFPIMPLHRLKERPTRRARLADLTCDSDGIIEEFVSDEGTQSALQLHELRSGERYLIGMFLVGAYQEILGDLHNLFGDTHAVHVRLKKQGGYSITHVVKGDTISEVLGYVQYDVEKMIESVRQQAEHSLEEGNMTLEQLRMFMSHYEEALRNYTYLSHLEEG